MQKGYDMIPCTNCHSIISNNYYDTIYFTPKIFVFIIKHNKDFKINFEFYEMIDLSQYVVRNEIGCKYKLLGVVSRFGSPGSNEYFISFCRSPIDNLWYKYNNDFISKVIDFKNEVIYSGSPEILFYQKIN